MRLSYTSNHEDNVYSITVFVSQKGTSALTEEEEKSILENYNRVIQFKNIKFEGYFDVKDNKIIEVPKVNDGEVQTGIKVTLNLVNQKKLISHDFKVNFEISLSQVKDNEISGNYTKDQVAEMKTLLFFNRIEEAVKKEVLDMKGRETDFESEEKDRESEEF